MGKDTSGQAGRRIRILGVLALLLEMGGLWLRGRRVAGNMIVRCRDGHLFTTLWIPGASFKALKLGLWRFQRCPVGHHWSVITPVNPATLSEAERREAERHRDIRIP